MSTKELKKISGSAIETKNLTNGKKANIIPIKMIDFPEFMENVMKVNMDTLYVNYLSEERKEALEAIFEMTFLNGEASVVVENTDANTFPILFRDILVANGINLDSGEENPN